MRPLQLLPLLVAPALAQPPAPQPAPAGLDVAKGPSHGDSARWTWLLPPMRLQLAAPSPQQQQQPRMSSAAAAQSAAKRPSTRVLRHLQHNAMARLSSCSTLRLNCQAMVPTDCPAPRASMLAQVMLRSVQRCTTWLAATRSWVSVRQHSPALTQCWRAVRRRNLNAPPAS